eukprot:12792255-Alexandrium_andersonii.AAC.1
MPHPQLEMTSSSDCKSSSSGLSALSDSSAWSGACCSSPAAWAWGCAGGRRLRFLFLCRSSRMR